LSEALAGVRPAARRPDPGFSTFLWVWLGRTVSLFGSGLTAFALGIWVYQTTGSVTRFGLLTFCSVIPTVVLSPVAGALVDRWDRRWAMMVADAGSALSWVALVLLFWAGSPRDWQVGLVVAASASFSALQLPALTASMTLLVPREQLNRANGLVELGASLSSLLAPLAAGFLVELTGVRGVILIDLATFLLSLGTLLLVRIPRPPRTEEAGASALGFWRGVGAGWGFIRSRRGFLALTAFSMILNFAFGTVQTLLTPLVLSFASSAVLGMVLSSAGVGMLAGGAAFVVWGARVERRVWFLLGAAALQGLLLLLGGVRPSALLVAGVAFGYMAAGSTIAVCSQTVWQRKVPPERQGRVIATRRMLATAAMSLSYVVTGLLADRVFEPLLAAGGPLSGSVGRVLGSGPGRGVALLFMSLGAVVLAAAVAGFRMRPLRELEKDLPDAVPAGA